MIDIGDAIFRPFLSADMVSAWSLTQVHHGEPTEATSATKFPRGFLHLGDIPPGEPRGIGVQTLLHPYECIGQFRYPTGNTTIEAEKTSRVSEFLALVTAGNTRYHSNYRYRLLGVGFDVAQLADNPTERYYTVRVSFGLEWETGT